MNNTPRTVILLEDDATLRALMAEGLTDAGCTVAESATGQAAQTLLATSRGHAILVADRSIDDGGPNGFQVAAQALDRYPNLHVIYVTGTHVAIRQRALGPRERALLKPFAVAQLVHAVRDLGA